MYLALFVVLCNELELQFLVHLYACHATTAGMFRLGRSQQYAQSIWLRTLTTMNIQSPGTHQPPTPSFRYVCFPIPHRMPATHAWVPYPTFPYTFSLSFSYTRKTDPFRAITSHVLVSYWFARWSRENPAVSFCPAASQ
jgi:hypothetical protein